MDMDIDRDDEVLNIGASVKQESGTTRSSKYHKLLRKSLEFFLTVSLLSLLLSSFTGLSYLHSYTYYFSTSFLLPLLDQALQRKFMFLLCNGILVFLAGLSGFRGTALSSSTRIQEGLSDGDDLQSAMMIREDDDEAIVLQAATPVDPLYAPAGASCGDSSVVSSRYSMVPSMMAVKEKEQLEAQEDKLEQVGKDWIEDEGGGPEENEEEKVNGSVVVGEEGDETDSEGPGSINTEELNRKIEEFIRKMKEELCLEAQQQHLIAV